MMKFTAVDGKWGYNNNGVTSSNVTVTEEGIILSAIPFSRLGAALKSNNLYSSGSFSFVAKTNADNGCTMAFWTFIYKDYKNPDKTNLNHEIDIELYGNNNIIYSTYLDEKESQSHVNSKVDYNINDNRYHLYRFDWYSGDRVEFYVDGILVCVIRDNIPTEDMYVWIGLWCPEWSIEKDEDGNATPPIIEGKVVTMTIKDFTYIPF